MNQLAGFGRVFFAAAMVGFGIQQFIYKEDRPDAKLPHIRNQGVYV